MISRHRETSGGCIIGVHVRRTDYKKLLGEQTQSGGGDVGVVQEGSIPTVLASTGPPWSC